VKVSANQKEAAEALVRSMNLMSAVPSNGGDGDEDEEPTESLVPKHTFNPALQRFYQCVERRALDPSADIVGEGLDPAIQRYLVPLPSVLRQAAPKLAAFKSAFDLRPVEETDKKAKKRHWKDWYSEELRDSDVAEMRKRARGFEEGGGGAAAAAAGGASATPSVSQTPGAPFSLDAAVADTVDHVGPIRPVADFHAMLARRDEAGIEVRAMDELAARIKDALVNSFAGSEYPRAFDGLQALRAACVRFEESERFNTLLAWLKKECAPTPEQPKKKHAEFFARMHAAMVLPIHSGEVPAAPLAQEEAQKFYEADVDMPAPPAAAAAAPQNEDDLFDSME
jgi:ATP-dependent DNA helicase 2 subunit 2